MKKMPAYSCVMFKFCLKIWFHEKKIYIFGPYVYL